MNFVLQAEPMNFGQAVFHAQQAYNGELAKLLNIDDKATIKHLLQAHGIGPGVEVWVGYCSPIEEDSRVGDDFKPGDPTIASPVVVRINQQTDQTVWARVNVDPTEKHPYFAYMS